MTFTLVAMASTLLVMTSTLIAMASALLVMTSTLIAMASALLLVMTSTLIAMASSLLLVMASTLTAMASALAAMASKMRKLLKGNMFFQIGPVGSCYVVSFGPFIADAASDCAGVDGTSTQPVHDVLRQTIFHKALGDSPSAKKHLSSVLAPNN